MTIEKRVWENNFVIRQYSDFITKTIGRLFSFYSNTAKTEKWVS